MGKGAWFLGFAIVWASIGLGQASQIKNYPFAVDSEKYGSVHRLVARNQGPAPISVRVSIPTAQNIATDRAFPVYAVVPPNGTLYLGTIGAAMQGAGYSFNTSVTWIPGDFNAVPTAGFAYRMPYQDGMAFQIGQAPGGPITTHNSPESQYAVDISMPQGTPVLAARDGVVIYTEAGNTEGGYSSEFMDKANSVQILHMDGSVAVYAHLAPGGVYVYPGQRVNAGHQIGLSGSTGYSAGPHLHFAIQTVQQAGEGFSAVSVPFRFFIGNPARMFSPTNGMIVRANYTSEAAFPGDQGAASLAGEKEKNGGPQIVFQIPEPVMRFVAQYEVWMWGGAVGLVLLFLITRRRREKLDVAYPYDREPGFRRRDE